MSDDKDQQINDLKARLAAIEAQTQPEKPHQPSAPKGNGCVPIFVACLLAVGLFSFCSSQNGGDHKNRAGQFANLEPAWLPPDGYSLFTGARGNGSRVGFKWVEPTNSECRGYNTTCFAAEVVTEKPCLRNLYASITLLSATGTNIGWTNDTAQGVEVGETVRLVFTTYERGVDSARIAEINCY